MNTKIFVTGGAGYIGTHTCVELLKRDYEVMVYDNLSNGSEDALNKVSRITNKSLEFYNGDICDLSRLTVAINQFKPDLILHFAGLKATGKSIESPVLYYDVNVNGSLNLLKAMSASGFNKIVFSSSATIYDTTRKPPYREHDAYNPLTPYGNTKLIVELLLKDWVQANESNKAISL